MFPLPLPSLRSSGANWCLPLIPLGDCCHGYIGARRELVQNPLPFCPPMLPRDWQARLRSSMNDPGLPVLAPCHSKMKSAGTPRIFTFSCPHPCSILTEQIPHLVAMKAKMTPSQHRPSLLPCKERVVGGPLNTLFAVGRRDPLLLDILLGIEDRQRCSPVAFCWPLPTCPSLPAANPTSSLKDWL